MTTSKKPSYPIPSYGMDAPDDAAEGCAANTDPPKVRCSWCGGRLRWESGGYWLTCPVSGHPSHHDPRIKGLWWRLRVAVGR